MVFAENSLKQVLLQAAEGLLYPSETDKPFEYFEWMLSDSQPLTDEVVRKYTQKGRTASLQSQSLDSFFAPVTTVRDWYQDTELAEMKRFVALKETILQNMTDVQVYKVGKTTIDVFIVGKTPTGKWAGLCTQVVET